MQLFGIWLAFKQTVFISHNYMLCVYIDLDYDYMQNAVSYCLARSFAILLIVFVLYQYK